MVMYVCMYVNFIRSILKPRVFTRRFTHTKLSQQRELAVQIKEQFIYFCSTKIKIKKNITINYKIVDCFKQNERTPP